MKNTSPRFLALPLSVSHRRLTLLLTQDFILCLSILSAYADEKECPSKMLEQEINKINEILNTKNPYLNKEIRIQL